MKISILSHCSHNKGDNSVLAFLGKIIPNNQSLHISTSSGTIPDWFESMNTKSSLWGCGKRFSTRNESFLSKVVRNIRNRLYDMMSYVVLFLYANKKDYLALLLLNTFIDKGFKQALKGSEKVICTGGHHISSVLDKDGVNPQLIDMLYSVLNGYKLYLWAQSIGPVETKKSYIITAISRILNASEFICYRDTDSLDFLIDNNIKTSSKLVDDSVFGLVQLLESKEELSDKILSKFVIVALYTAGKKQKDNIENYLNAFVKPLKRLIFDGYVVKLLPMQYKGLQDDERKELLKLKELINDDKVEVLIDDMSPIDTIKYISNASLLIGHKTHSVVYGLANVIPTIAISYHPKTTYFMHRFCQDEFVIEDSYFSEDLLQNKISLIYKNYNQVIVESKKSNIGKNVVSTFNEMMQ